MISRLGSEQNTPAVSRARGGETRSYQQQATQSAPTGTATPQPAAVLRIGDGARARAAAEAQIESRTADRAEARASVQEQLPDVQLGPVVSQPTPDFSARSSGVSNDSGDRAVLQQPSSYRGPTGGINVVA